jgi:MarR family transcriptional regulator, organic hydroperoxide resistance regulator
MKCAMSDRLVRLGISMAQLNILHTLQRTGEMPMSRLADVLNVSVSNATGLVDRMEERGLIERRRVPEDRRVVLVRITADGGRILEENDALTDDMMREVLSDLDPTQLQVIARAVAQFRSSLETTVDVHARDRHLTSTAAPRSR